jgi:hypothetical protein
MTSDAAFKEALRLLRELVLRPDYPTPADGEMADATLFEDREQWLEKYGDLDKRVADFLALHDEKLEDK